MRDGVEGGGGPANNNTKGVALIPDRCEEEDAFALALGSRQWSEEQNPHESWDQPGEWGQYQEGEGERRGRSAPPRKRPRKPQR